LGQAVDVSFNESTIEIQASNLNDFPLIGTFFFFFKTLTSDLLLIDLSYWFSALKLRRFRFQNPPSSLVVD
jgi:hypothetical protein